MKTVSIGLGAFFGGVGSALFLYEPDRWGTHGAFWLMIGLIFAMVPVFISIDRERRG